MYRLEGLTLKMKKILLGICICMIISAVAGIVGNIAGSIAEPNVPEDVLVYSNCSFETANNIDIYEAPVGYKYVITTVDINNTGTHTYSTNPLYWSLISQNVTYGTDIATYATNHQTVDVGPGGNIKTQFAFLVPESSTEGRLSYSGPKY